MSLLTNRCVAALAIAAITVACSPSLNWRKITLEGLVVWLPCKPDHAERRVQLGSLDAVLRMSGCEASEALYAISHVRVLDTAQVEESKSAWRQATFAAMQATEGSAPTLLPNRPVTGQANETPKPEQREGKRPDGSVIQAQFVWLSKGQDLYQVAVYGSKLDKEKTELLFSELRLQ